MIPGKIESGHQKFRPNNTSRLQHFVLKVLPGKISRSFLTKNEFFPSFKRINLVQSIIFAKLAKSEKIQKNLFFFFGKSDQVALELLFSWFRGLYLIFSLKSPMRRSRLKKSDFLTYLLKILFFKNARRENMWPLLCTFFKAKNDQKWIFNRFLFKVLLSHILIKNGSNFRSKMTKNYN